MKKTVQTGTLTLEVAKNMTGRDEDELFDIAARANPKRGFLIVSKLIGRHIPTRPSVMRASMANLAELIDRDLPGPVIFLGMAETAVGLGQGVHAAWREMTGRDDAWFIQSTRQTHPELTVWATFEEGHSHATNHLVHLPEDIDVFRRAKSLVVVDDECSTGTTFIKVEEAMRAVMPELERVVDVVITEWSQSETRERVSLVSGTMCWEPNGVVTDIPGENASRHGMAKIGAAPGRTGYRRPANITLSRVPDVIPGERITVLADGENAYDALRIAELLEAKGAIAAVQSITRSPAHVGGAMSSRTVLSDAHGSGATCYSYNLEAHRPDRFVVVAEIPSEQVEEISRGTGHPVTRVNLVEMTR
jgi:hypothetical protein